MTKVRTRRPRDPAATREVILEAARGALARGGPDALSVSGVAAAAGVNRGTAYQHFATRDDLLAATAQSVSDELLRTTFGDAGGLDGRVEDVDIVRLTTSLADFAVDNPVLCRIWFLQLLASPDPSRDPFWRQYAGMLRRFTETELAQPGIDSEVFALTTLAGNFLWPVWSRAHDRSAAERRQLSRRFAIEIMRLSMHGTMRADRFPEIERLILGDGAPPRAA